MDPESQGRPGLRRPRPLLLRPEARFACEGDGLCCSDLHALGPVSAPEAAALRRDHPGAVVRHRRLKILMLRPETYPGGGHTCAFLGPGGCAIYDRRPATCRRFPLGLTATPSGLRVTTEHRCPCRSLGPSSPLDPDHARAALIDGRGRLVPDLRVGDRVPLRARSRVAFARYEAEFEAPLIAALLAGQGASALGVEPFPRLDGATWRDVAHLLRGHLDGSSGGEAAAFFGEALLVALGDQPRPLRARPWAWAFDRAEARAAPASPASVLGDWAADVIWSLAWVERGSLALVRLDLATRLAVASTVIGSLVAAGVRPDRAAAEAVMMAEVAGALPLWDSVAASIRQASADLV